MRFGGFDVLGVKGESVSRERPKRCLDRSPKVGQEGRESQFRAGKKKAGTSTTHHSFLSLAIGVAGPSPKNGSANGSSCAPGVGVSSRFPSPNRPYAPSSAGSSYALVEVRRELARSW